jgi:hypothetical protein
VATSTSERFNIGVFPESAPVYYRWEVAGKPATIRLSLDVIDRLSGEIISQFANIHSRGSELGGILLGRVAGADETTFFIDDYELIECDHKLGALFVLSDEDKSRMVDQLLRLRCSPSRSVVGFFRSHTRKNLGLDERDLSLIRDYFADAANVFLLVKPFAAKPSTAGFFIWEDGHIWVESSYRQFPFKRSELVIRSHETVLGGDAGSDITAIDSVGSHKASERDGGTTLSRDGAADITPPLEEQPQNFEVQNSIDPLLRQISREPTERRQFSAQLDLEPEWSIWQQSPPTVLSRVAFNFDDTQLHSSITAASGAPGPGVSSDPQSEAAWQDDSAAMTGPAAGRLWLRWISILLFLAVIGTAYVESRRARSIPPANPANNTLDLSIARDATGLELQWNQHAAPIATATSGNIQIEDGDRRKTLELTVDQLRFGKVIYFPLSNDVSFQLEVTDTADSRSISESIHAGGRLGALPKNSAGRC